MIFITGALRLGCELQPLVDGYPLQAGNVLLHVGHQTFKVLLGAAPRAEGIPEEL